MASKPVIEQRRFPRVQMPQAFAKAQGIIGAHAIWPNQETVDVYDMSYTGIAVGKPVLFEIRVHDTVNLGCELMGIGTTHVSARIIWSSANAVGMEFGTLSSEARVFFDDFLDDKLIGQHMRAVDRSYFASNQDFTHWFHGPKDTHVFIWWDEKTSQVVKAVIQLDEQILVFADGQLTSGGTNPFQRRQDDLAVLLDRDMPIARRVLDLLSQMGTAEARSPLRRLMADLLGEA